MSSRIPGALFVEPLRHADEPFSPGVGNPVGVPLNFGNREKNSLDALAYPRGIWLVALLGASVLSLATAALPRVRWDTRYVVPLLLLLVVYQLPSSSGMATRWGLSGTPSKWAWR